MRGLPFIALCATFAVWGCDDKPKTDTGIATSEESDKAPRTKAGSTMQDRLDGTAWVLAELPGVSLVDGSEVTVRFGGGRASGSGGCNRFKATYRVDAGRLEIGPIASTRRRCANPDGVMEQEATFFKALEGIHVARLQGDRLELRSDAGSLVVAARRAAAPASPGRPRESEATQAMGGEMRYLADAASFADCKSGRSYPIAMEGDFRAAERAYRNAVETPGNELYVTFEGAVSPRPAVDRAGAEDTIVIHRFIHAWPGERCERARADAALVNTYWRIVRVGEAALKAEEGRREPHIVVSAENGTLRYRATVGCNQLAGGLEIDDDTITFESGPTTLMACPPPLDAHERALSMMLSEAKRWRVVGNTLELFDRSGRSIALLQAVYL